MQGMNTKRTIDPEKVYIGDIVLVASRNKVTEWVQKRLGFGAASKWTHIAGSLGAGHLIEGQMPRSRLANLQDDYVAKGFEIRVLRKKGWEGKEDRFKVALWWASMNNLGYDFGQLAWFGIACFTAARQTLLLMQNKFNSLGRKICSELVAEGFYKEGYNLFDVEADNVMPAHYDQCPLFEEMMDIWETE